MYQKSMQIQVPSSNTNTFHLYDKKKTQLDENTDCFTELIHFRFTTIFGGINQLSKVTL